MNYWQKLFKLPNDVALGVIYIYRMVFSPSVGILRFLPFYPKNTCIFYPTCSEYARICFEKHTFFIALYKTANRVRRCHPGNEPSVDHP